MTNKFLKFIKSKSVVDFVYMVMMILIVTMIKDMVVSMYKKRKDKQWLDQAFGKTKGKKNVEGFSSTGPVCPENADTICNKLKYLLCEEKFNILKKYIDADWVNKSDGANGTYYRLNTKGGNVYTMGGHIYTNKYNDGLRHINNNSQIDHHNLNYNPTSSGHYGGNIRTGGGYIKTYGGNLNTKRSYDGVFTIVDAGNVYYGDGVISTT